MSEESFEQLLNEEVVNQIHTGSVVKGKVIGVKENEISMNIGYKSDGIITKSEYTNDTSVDLKEVVHVGDEMEVKVLRLNDGEGQVLLSYKRLAQDRSFKAIEEAFENHTVMTGKVTQVMTGGLTVNADGARVFIPASLVADGFERNLNKYEGQDVEFYVTEYNPKRRRIVGDRKQLIIERKKAARDELMSRIAEGMIVTGKVKNITDFGAFIDLGGADGLLHISEMTWGRIDNPKKLYKVGDEVEAFIKEISGDKIALSVKFPDKNPWTDPNGRYGIGNIVKGRVARMTDFGAFVDLEPGVDALLHVSQISSERVEKPQDVLSIGQEITTKIVDFIPEEHKINLSIKAMEMDMPKNDEVPEKSENEAVTDMAAALENVTLNPEVTE